MKSIGEKRRAIVRHRPYKSWKDENIMMNNTLTMTRRIPNLQVILALMLLLLLPLQRKKKAPPHHHEIHVNDAVRTWVATKSRCRHIATKKTVNPLTTQSKEEEKKKKCASIVGPSVIRCHEMRQ